MSKYAQLPECFEYHEKSELRGRAGYYPNINSEQLKAASELIALIEKENLRFNVDEENEFLKLCRFLRARKWSVTQALHMIKEDIKWRSEENRLNLRSETAEQVLGCDVGSLYRYFPTWIQGRDKQMRPVSYRQFGKFEIWNVLKLTSMQRLIRFHAWETEQALRFMHSKSHAENVNIETFVLVIDAAGWNVHLATRDAFTFIKGMASTDSDHYPERLGTLVVINAPTALAWAWGVVQGFLDQVTKSKIKIIGSNRADWLPVLLDLIDEDQIPQQFGGKAEDLPPDQAIMQMNPNFEFPDEKGIDGSTKKKKPLMVTLDQGTQTDDPIDLLEDLEAARCGCTIS